MSQSHISETARRISVASSSSSLGSEEVRCSLAELDAVISVFDEEFKRHRRSQTLSSTVETPNLFLDPSCDGWATIRSPPARANSTGTSFPVDIDEIELPPPPSPEKVPTSSFTFPPPPVASICDLEQRFPSPPDDADTIPVPSAHDVDDVFMRPTIPVRPRNQCSGRPKVPERHPSTRLSTVSLCTSPLAPSAPEEKLPVCSRDRAFCVNATITPAPQPIDDTTVPPVGDIIRRLSRAATGPTNGSPRSVSEQLPAFPLQPRPADASVPCRKILPKPNNTTNIAIRECSPAPFLSTNPDVVPSPTVQELARGFTAAAATTTVSTSVRTPPSELPSPSSSSKVFQRYSGPVICPTTTAPKKVDFLSKQRLSQQLDVSDHHLVDRLPCGVPISNAIGLTSASGAVPLLSLRLDKDILEVLRQYNVVDARQIPGFQPLPTGVPAWKVHKLERSNRDAAKAHAEDLRKWGQVPKWKRQLLSKRSNVKEDNHIPVFAAPSDSRQSLNTVISAELTEKLQRRLELVDSSPST